ncbi:MAG: MASE3 domain-containing protein [Motiliproteus sp.]
MSSQQQWFDPLISWRLWLFPALLSVVLIVVAQFNFLLFHTLAEFFAIVISFIMFAFVFATRYFVKNSFLLFLACGYFWIGGLDLLHALTYKGMPFVVVGVDDLAIQFWIGTRYLEALLLLAAPLWASRNLNQYLLLALFGVIATALVFFISNGGFPTLYVEGQGLTDFKIYSEYLIDLILACAIITLLWRGGGIPHEEKTLIMAAIVLTMCAELAFTFYVSVYGFSNLVGHIFKLFSFWLIFHAVVLSNLRKPISRLDRLQQYNRSLFETSPMGLALSDMDGVLVDVNPAYANILGRSVEETLGLGRWQITPEKHASLDQQQLRKLKKTGEYGPYCKEYQTKDGSLIPVQLSGKLIKLGGEEFVWSSVEDISQRQQAEQALMTSETRFRDLFEHAEVSIWNEDLSAVVESLQQLRAEGVTHLRKHLQENPVLVEELCNKVKVLHVNQATLKLFGTHSEQQFLTGISRTFGANAMAVFADELCAIWQGNKVFRAEASFSAFDGREINAIVSFSLPETVDGFASIPVSLLDITDRKQAEQLRVFQARRSEVLLQLPKLAEQLTEKEFMQHGLSLAEDLTGSCISFMHFVNDDENSIELVAWSKQTLDLYCHAAFDSHYPVSEAGIWADALRQRQPVVFNDYLNYPHKMGLPEGHSELHRLISLPLIENLRVVMLTGVGNKETAYSDIDIETVQLISNEVWSCVQRRRSEAQLNKLAQAVEQSSESIIITNIDAEIEYVNKTFEQRTGYSLAEVLGKNPRLLKSGKTPNETYTAMWDAISHGRAWKGELLNRNRAGVDYTEFAHITPLQQDGKITHYVAVKEDITEKVRLAKELDEHRHHLEELIEQRTEQLTDARRRAEDANQAKSTFLANMSHEIRTPMNAVIGLTHLMRRDGSKVKQEQRLDKIDAAAKHLLSIINDILDLSKIEAGKLTLEKSDFHLAAIFDQVHSLLRVQAKGKGLDIVINHDAVPMWLTGDSTRLRQALLNFAGNAVKFTERGCVTLKAEMLEDQGEQVLIRFEVQDTGIGIDPDKLSDLFNAFEQADSSTTRKYGGSGLGLAITRRLAQVMGGNVGAESELGRGSTFWFTVRLERCWGERPLTTTARVVDAEADLRANHSGCRILLAEDNPINREVATELLSSAGLLVDTAENGRQALERIHQHVYDLVLMDLQMPEMDGIEATRLIRSIPMQSNLPVLAMTANIFEEDRQTCREVGMNDFVAKPVDPENLYLTLSKWLPEKNVGQGSGGTARAEPAAAKNQSEVVADQMRQQLDAIDGLEAKIGLRNMRGDARAYLRLLSQFDQSHGDDAEQLRQAFDLSDFDGARNLTHTLKGTAGTLGLTDMQEISMLLETRLRHLSHKPEGQEEREEALSLIDTFAATLALFRQSMENLRIDLDPQPFTAADQRQLQPLLQRLQHLLAQDNTAANALFLDSEMLLRSALGAKAEQLGQHIAHFDYPAALLLIESLAELELEVISDG